METTSELEILSILRRTAIWFGLIAGLAFSIVLLGIDGVQLALAHAYYPWAKLLMGLIPITGFCVLVALLAQRIDNALVSFLLWLVTGVVISLFASHLPFEGMSLYLRIFDPQLAGRVQYPFNAGAAVYTGTGLLIATVLAGIGGVLFNLFVQNAANSTAVGATLLSLLIWAGLFIGGASSISTMVYSPMRGPVIAMNRLVEADLHNNALQLVKGDAGYVNTIALNKAAELVNLPRKLVLEKYDDNIIQTWVQINFAGNWVQCTVMSNKDSEPPVQIPIYCYLAD